MSLEFSSDLLDVVAQALFLHDVHGRAAVEWETLNPLSQKTYVKFAQVALEAVYSSGEKSEEQYVVCGIMPIEGHPDYKFCSNELKTLKEAEELRECWIEQSGSSGATYVIEHSARIVLNTLKYWTKEDIARIHAVAKARAEEMAKYVD